jgi:hypothetical protein
VRPARIEIILNAVRVTQLEFQLRFAEKLFGRQACDRKRE